ncbi:hypothetical protein ASE04_29690 [Rhizobium sp. Root708]|nr:hypothetical protein ASE04_29690 [Rhizobium sp. Root708]
MGSRPRFSKWIGLAVRGGTEKVTVNAIRTNTITAGRWNPVAPVGCAVAMANAMRADAKPVIPATTGTTATPGILAAPAESAAVMVSATPCAANPAVPGVTVDLMDSATPTRDQLALIPRSQTVQTCAPIVDASS